MSKKWKKNINLKFIISKVKIVILVAVTGFFGITACLPGDSTSTYRTTGVAFTYNGVYHYITGGNKMHAYSPYSPCSSTTSCKTCHSSNGSSLDGQSGYDDPSTLSIIESLNPPSCTNCHSVKWSSDLKWDSTNTVCIP